MRVRVSEEYGMKSTKSANYLIWLNPGIGRFMPLCPAGRSSVQKL